MNAVRALAIPAATLLLAGCYGGLSTGSATHEAGPSFGQTDPSPREPTEADLARAIHFRSTAGLRSDREFVRTVALDPRASAHEYSVPLLPEEIAELQARSANAEVVAAAVAKEAAAHPDDYCGVWIDHQNEGALTSAWRANLATHEAAVMSQVDPKARVAFVSCTYSLATLETLQDRIAADWEELRAMGIALQAVGAQGTSNVLEIEVSSTLPNIAQLLADRYDVPVGMLAVTSDGTGAAYIPWGAVDVTVVGPGGREVARDNQLMPGWVSAVNGLRCGHGDVGVGFIGLPCQEGTWIITANAQIADGQWVTIGQGTVDVAAGRTSKLTIEVGPIPTYRPY